MDQLLGRRPAETVVYRTRNQIVTDIIVGMINGGSISRAGEVTYLKRLLRACNGGAPAYREFCVRVLVPNNRKELQDLDYIQGLDLYTAAVSSLPFEDRTLLHHMGLWQKNKGQNPMDAKQTLERALQTKVFPYATKGESTEHIYTSLAANELVAIRQQKVGPEDGKKSVLGYLERARSSQSFDPYTVHVHAGLIAGLADVTRGTSSADWTGMINTAIGDIDRMLLVLRSGFNDDPERRHHIDLLEQAKSEVLDRCSPIAETQEEAFRLWRQHHTQQGFALTARRLYAKAQRTNSGSDYKVAFDFCLQVKAELAEAKATLSPEVAEAMLHIYFHWRVRRNILAGATDPIDWCLLEDLASTIARATRWRSDAFYAYVIALARAHQENWTGAHAIFDDLRKRPLPGGVLWEDRDYLMTATGGMRRVQGVLKAGAARVFVKAEEVGTDFPVGRTERMGRDGDTVHVYVRFRFAGPIATLEP